MFIEQRRSPCERLCTLNVNGQAFSSMESNNVTIVSSLTTTSLCVKTRTNIPNELVNNDNELIHNKTKKNV